MSLRGARRSTPPAIILVILLLVTGAIGAHADPAPHLGPADPPATTAPAPGMDASAVREVRFYGCLALFGYVGMPRIEAITHLPPGYALTRFLANGFPHNQFVGSTVFAQECARVETDTGYVTTDYREIMHILRVIPPAHEDRFGGDSLPMRFMTNDAFLADLYTMLGWGDTAIHGEVAFSFPLVTDEGAEGIAAATNTEWSMTMTNTVAPGPAPAGVGTINFYATDDARNVVSVSAFDIVGGSVWQGGASATFGHGTATAMVATGGIGQAFAWEPDEITQVLRLHV